MQEKYPVLLLSFEMKGEAQTNTTQRKQTETVVQLQKFHFFILQAGDGGAPRLPLPRSGRLTRSFPTLDRFPSKACGLAILGWWVAGFRVNYLNPCHVLSKSLELTHEETDSLLFLGPDEYFSQGCAPGYEKNSSLCELCMGPNKCAPNNREGYFGYTGAFRWVFQSWQGVLVLTRFLLGSEMRSYSIDLLSVAHIRMRDIPPTCRDGVWRGLWVPTELCLPDQWDCQGMLLSSSRLGTVCLLPPWQCQEMLLMVVILAGVPPAWKGWK